MTRFLNQAMGWIVAVCLCLAVAPPNDGGDADILIVAAGVVVLWALLSLALAHSGAALLRNRRLADLVKLAALRERHAVGLEGNATLYDAIDRVVGTKAE